MIIVNFKTYKESTEDRALKLAKQIEIASIKSKTKVIIAVPALYLKQIKEEVSIPDYAQHADSEGYGGHTGKILLENLKQMGIKGTLLNHSEYTLKTDTIKETVKKAKKLGIEIILCANTPRKAKELSKLKPDYIAIEPPELIGGTVSVSSAKPQVITNTVKNVDVPVLCGAGVHNAKDVEKAIELGAKGILIASGVVLNSNPGKEIWELSKGFK
ncbi:MAG: triose-phosphate isomerase [Candidatus Woesearchaeota archaeon]